MADTAADAAFAAHDPAFLQATGPAPSLVRVVQTDVHEGAVYAPDEDALSFTTVPRPGRNGPLTSPNDVVGNTDGTVCLTDPSYGAVQAAGRHPDRARRHETHMRIKADFDPTTQEARAAWAAEQQVAA
jgi:sugar lactone lactonase YvrE